MKFLSSHWLMAHGYLKTSSRLRKLWLTKVKGYRIATAVQSPKKNFLGRRIAYSTIWVLKPADRS